jgi:hypothetical protein
MKFCPTTDCTTTHFLSTQVRIILEAQDEAAAYHNSVQHMDQAGYGAPTALPPNLYPFANTTSADPYPIDPFPRTFWYMFFLVSPTAALIWYNAVELTFDGLMVCSQRF